MDIASLVGTMLGIFAVFGGALLEGLHLSKRLNKDAISGRATYRSRS